MWLGIQRVGAPQYSAQRLGVSSMSCPAAIEGLLVDVCPTHGREKAPHACFSGKKAGELHQGPGSSMSKGFCFHDRQDDKVYSLRNVCAPPPFCLYVSVSKLTGYSRFKPCCSCCESLERALTCLSRAIHMSRGRGRGCSIKRVLGNSVHGRRLAASCLRISVWLGLLLQYQLSSLKGLENFDQLWLQACPICKASMISS